MKYPPESFYDALGDFFDEVNADGPAIERVLAESISGILQHLPLSYWNDERGQAWNGPTMPLYDAIDDIGQMIVDAVLPILYDKELVENGHLSALRKQLFENEAAMNGLTLYGRRSKAIPAPQERDEPPRERCELYFKDTPYLKLLLDTHVPFAIPKKALSEHCFIVAKPGHGKTVLLSSFAAQFLQDPTQPGLFCLDPAGDWFEKLRDRVPPERLVVLDPETNPPPLNFFSFGTSSEAEMLGSFTYLMSALSGGLSDKQGAIVPYLLKLLRQIPGASLETLRLIVDEKVKSPAHSQFAPQISALPSVDQGFFHNQFYSGSMQETKQAIAWKIYNALSSDAFRKMFSAPTNSFDAAAAMRERKVVLVRGSELTLGEHGLAVFLQYVVSQFFLASLARFRIPEKDRHQCYLLCDEASHIFNPQIKRILVECRKLGLSFFGATQVIDQIPTEVKASIYGATSIKCAGNISHTDAQQMAREMRTDGDTIQRLKTFEWMMHVADMDRAVKVVVRPGAVEALPKYKPSIAERSEALMNRMEREAAARREALNTHEGSRKPEPQSAQPLLEGRPAVADPTIIPDSALTDIELVVSTARRLEAQLTARYSATGRGLHEKLDDAQRMLPDHLLHRGRYIATMRNKTLHQDGFSLPDRDWFVSCAKAFEEHFSKPTPQGADDDISTHGPGGWKK